MDTTTVIGVLDDQDAAEQAMDTLRGAGFADLEVLAGDEREIAAEASTLAAAVVVDRPFPRLPAASATPVPFLLSGRNMLHREMFRCDAA